MASPDWISLLEATYDLSGDLDTWLGGLMHAAAPVLDEGNGVAVQVFRLRPVGIAIERAGHRGPEEVGSLAIATIDAAASEAQDLVYRSGIPAATMSEVVWSRLPGEKAFRQRCHRRPLPGRDRDRGAHRNGQRSRAQQPDGGVPVDDDTGTTSMDAGCGTRGRWSVSGCAVVLPNSRPRRFSTRTAAYSMRRATRASAMPANDCGTPFSRSRERAVPRVCATPTKRWRSGRAWWEVAGHWSIASRTTVAASSWRTATRRSAIRACSRAAGGGVRGTRAHAEGDRVRARALAVGRRQHRGACTREARPGGSRTNWRPSSRPAGCAADSPDGTRRGIDPGGGGAAGDRRAARGAEQHEVALARSAGRHQRGDRRAARGAERAVADQMHSVFEKLGDHLACGAGGPVVAVAPTCGPTRGARLTLARWPARERYGRPPANELHQQRRCTLERRTRFRCADGRSLERRQHARGSVAQRDAIRSARRRARRNGWRVASAPPSTRWELQQMGTRNDRSPSLAAPPSQQRRFDLVVGLLEQAGGVVRVAARDRVAEVHANRVPNGTGSRLWRSSRHDSSIVTGTTSSAGAASQQRRSPRPA